jgi:hypothetical protein
MNFIASHIVLTKKSDAFFILHLITLAQTLAILVRVFEFRAKLNSGQKHFF